MIKLEFEKEQGGDHGTIWMEKRGGNIVIILYLQKKEYFSLKRDRVVYLSV